MSWYGNSETSVVVINGPTITPRENNEAVLSGWQLSRSSRGGSCYGSAVLQNYNSDAPTLKRHQKKVLAYIREVKEMENVWLTP